MFSDGRFSPARFSEAYFTPGMFSVGRFTPAMLSENYFFPTMFSKGVLLWWQFPKVVFSSSNFHAPFYYRNVILRGSFSPTTISGCRFTSPMISVGRFTPAMFAEGYFSCMIIFEGLQLPQCFPRVVSLEDLQGPFYSRDVFRGLFCYSPAMFSSRKRPFVSGCDSQELCSPAIISMSFCWWEKLRLFCSSQKIRFFPVKH